MASHSSRKRSSRRAAYRQGNKRQRAATRQALAGGHSKLIRPEHWNQRPEQPLLPDEGYPAQPMIKPGPRKPGKDVYCPGRSGQKRHHFIGEVREVPAFRWDFCGSWFDAAPSKELYEICAWCGKERTRRIHD